MKMIKVKLMAQPKRLSIVKIISPLLVWLLIWLGVGLRVFKADTFPIDNNDDGLYYVWAGNSFLDNPLKVTSHTIFDKGNQNLIWRSQFMDYIPVERFGLKIARPWFDHPPLGAILISLPAKLLGYQPFEQIPHLIVRLPALIAGVFTLYLTYVLAADLFGPPVGLFSLLFLATTPYFVFAARQSFLENFLTPVALAAAIFLRRKQLTKMWLAVAVAGLIKIVGLGVGLMMTLWLWYQKKKRQAFITLAVTVITFGLYLTYGLLADRGLFLTTLLNQGGRGATFASFFHSLTRPEFYGGFDDGLYVLSLLFSFMILLRAKTAETKFYSVMVLSWWLILFLVSGKTANSPWFKYPLIPYMAMALGYYAHKLITKPNVYLLALWYFLGLTGLALLNWPLSTGLVRLVTVGLLIPPLFFRKSTKYLSYALLVTIIIINLVTVVKFPTVNCLQKQCLLPIKLILN